MTKQQLILAGKKMILQDIIDGHLPEDIDSLEMCHEYVDANVYISNNFEFCDDIPLLNEVSIELDKWLHTTNF